MSLIAFTAETAAEGAGHAEGGGAFPPFEAWHFPSHLFWLTILFGALYLILSRGVLPRLGSMMERRQDTIANDLDEAARLDEQASEAEQALELRIAEAKAKARETAGKARAKIEEEIARETAKVDEEVDDKLADAEARITELRTAAMTNVASVAADTAAVMTSRFGVKPSEAAVQSAVKAALS